MASGNTHCTAKPVCEPTGTCSRSQTTRVGERKMTPAWPSRPPPPTLLASSSAASQGWRARGASLSQIAGATVDELDCDEPGASLDERDAACAARGGCSWRSRILEAEESWACGATQARSVVQRPATSHTT